MNNLRNNLHHDPLITMEEMTPEEYRNEGKHLEIHYSFASCPFGEVLVASTQKGICSLTFVPDEETKATDELQKKFPKAKLRLKAEPSHESALSFFKQDAHEYEKIKLHLKSTAFQLEVWEALLEIPLGKLVSYGDIARKTGHPKAYRAVGTAVGDNPVFFIIPCHRVIQSSGAIGNYYWGSELKKEIIEWEKKI